MTNDVVTIEPIKPEDRDAFAVLMFANLVDMHGRGFGGQPFSDAFKMEKTAETWNTMMGFNLGTLKETRAKRDDKGFIVAKNEVGKLRASTYQCQVARQNGKIIGYVEYTVRGSVRINHIVVANEFRGKGLAKALLSAAAADIKAHKKSEFSLSVRLGNESSLALFEGLARGGLLENIGHLYVNNFPLHYNGFKGEAERLIGVYPTQNFTLPVLPVTRTDERPPEVPKGFDSVLG